MLFISQLAIGLVLGVAAAVFLVSTGKMFGPDPAAQTEILEKAIIRFLLPVATFATLLTAVGVVAFLFRKRMARCIGLCGLTATQTGLVLLLALPLAVLTSEFTNCAAHLLPNVSLDLFESFSEESWPLIFFAACLFPGIGEEIFFRGFLSRGLVAHHGVLLGTLLTSLLFGVIHLHPIQACGAFALGLVLQFVFLKTKSLWGAVLLHSANNLLAFAAMKYGERFPIRGFTAVSKEDITHTPLLLIFAAAAAVAMLLFVLHRTRTQWLLPDGSLWSRGYQSAEVPERQSAARRENRPATVSLGVALLVAYSAFGATLALSVAR